MSSLSEARLSRGRVLHDVQVSVTPADLGTVSARPARGIVVSQELVEAATREGYEAGFNQGFEEGYSEGITQAAQHVQLLAGLVQRLGQAADALMTREATARHEIENDVVAAAVTIAEELVRHELQNPDARGRDAIARALQLTPDHGLVTARLSPADLAVINEAGDLQTGRALELVADPSLSPGDCIVDVGACRIDARIDAAFARMREVLS
jgi:flagellar assembly protein FliH